MPPPGNPALLAYRRLLHAVDNHGWAGALRRAVEALRSRLPGRPSSAPNPQPPACEAHPFDALHGTDTAGYDPGETLAGATSATGLYNTAYYGISPSTLAHALSLLPPAAAGATFVDLGCGKGRALLVAAAATPPFSHLLGVELDPTLAATARANLARLPAGAPPAQVLTADAAACTFPAGPLVVFLYHPFLAPLLTRMLASLELQLRATQAPGTGHAPAPAPAPAWLLYANPTDPRVMAQFPFLQLRWDHRLPLSPEDAAADRHGITHERYQLFEAIL